MGGPGEKVRPVPECVMTLSGRCDGGVHRYVCRPPGRLTATLAPGIDLKTSCGYAVIPPGPSTESVGVVR